MLNKLLHYTPMAGLDRCLRDSAIEREREYKTKQSVCEFKVHMSINIPEQIIVGKLSFSREEPLVKVIVCYIPHSLECDTWLMTQRGMYECLHSFSLSFSHAWSAL